MKPWWQSKTIWLNLILSSLAFVQSMSPTLLPPVAGPWLLFGAGLMNVWLRIIHDTLISTPNRQ